jgi:hypothetical protein
MKRFLAKSVTWYLVVAMCALGFVPRVEAGFSPSAVNALDQMGRQADLVKIQKILELKMVKERLEKLGFTTDEIQMKLSNLSDDQIHQLASNLDGLKVGGDGGWIIVVLLLIIIAAGVYFMASGKKIMVQ